MCELDLNKIYPYQFFYTSTRGIDILVDKNNKDHCFLWNKLIEFRKECKKLRYMFDYNASTDDYFKKVSEIVTLIDSIKYYAKKVFGFYVGSNWRNKYIDVSIRIGDKDHIDFINGNYCWIDCLELEKI